MHFQKVRPITYFHYLFSLLNFKTKLILINFLKTFKNYAERPRHEKVLDVAYGCLCFILSVNHHNLGFTKSLQGFWFADQIQTQMHNFD